MEISKWTPGDYRYIEDVPGWEKQLAYYDIARKIASYVEKDNELVFKDTDSAQKAVIKFNAWFLERVVDLSEKDRLEISQRFGGLPARIEGSYRVAFNYHPVTMDYRDLLTYVYEDRDNKEPYDKSYWPTGMLTHKPREVEEKDTTDHKKDIDWAA